MYLLDGPDSGHSMILLWWKVIKENIEEEKIPALDGIQTIDLMFGSNGIHLWTALYSKFP